MKTDKEFRQALVSFVGEMVKEKFGKWPSFSAHDVAFLLQGAAFLSGNYAAEGEMSYRLIAWDFIGCLEQLGEITKCRAACYPGAKPWANGEAWEVVKQEPQS